MRSSEAPRRPLPLRRWNAATHRDVGYFCSALIVAYCVSGLALNHIDDWNPDFILHRERVVLPSPCPELPLTTAQVASLAGAVHEERVKTWDSPTPGQVKLYFDNASFHVDLEACAGTYERVLRRPLVFQANVLHRNSLKGWKWASDIFAVLLILVGVTGVFMLPGRRGITGRGKWWMLAGLVPPFVAMILFEMLS